MKPGEMTVGKLREILSDMPDDLPVVSTVTDGDGFHAAEPWTDTIFVVSGPNDYECWSDSEPTADGYTFVTRKVLRV